MFIDRLDEILKIRRMSGAELSKKLGLSSSNYSYWKKGKNPNTEILKKIADILDVSADWLLGRENALDPEETKLLNNFRSADERGKRRISSLAEEEAQEQILLISGDGNRKNKLV